MAALSAPTIDDVRQARERIGPYLAPTPFRAYPALSRLVGADVWVKHENHQPTGAFKVRGGINLICRLSDDERRRGVIAASTGNHGQSVAYAAQLFGVPATICVPERSNPVKVRAIEDFGAEVLPGGADYDEARERCERLAAERGLRYIHSGDEPLLIAGVGTLTLEALETVPELDVLLVPVGGGSGAAGACIVAAGVRPELEVIGVQSEAAPAAYRSWRERRLVEDSSSTFAEGLATRVGFELPQAILWERLNEFVLVSDQDIRAAMLAMIESTRNLVESSGAAPLAGALQLRDRLAGRKVGLVCSGGNVSPDQLREVLAQPT